MCSVIIAVSVGSVFDQFGGGGSTGGWTGTQGGGDRGGQGGETVGFGPAIEDFTGGREGKVTARGSETPGEIMPRGAGEAGTAIGPVMPNFGQLVPRITLDLVEQVRLHYGSTHIYAQGALALLAHRFCSAAGHCLPLC